MKNKIYKNKKVFLNYSIIYKLEAGIVLTGDEVKSIRENGVSFEGCYAAIENHEAWIYNLYISEYKNSSNIVPYDPIRKRKLLLHKHQIEEIAVECKAKGFTLVPIEIYFANDRFTQRLIKVQLALAKGKKKHDKRQAEKELEFKKEIREL